MNQNFSCYRVQPIVTILFGTEAQVPDVKQILRETWGAVSYRSDPIPFDVTDYYEEEMGSDLKKCICAFDREMDASELVAFKQTTTEIERKFSEGGDRRVNIDPGYIDPAKLVLASWKENGQKIYLSDGVFADLVLFYEKGDWEPLPWTFPDFRSGRYDEDLTRIRTDWKRNRGKADRP